jgi:hypothetical protein
VTAGEDRRYVRAIEAAWSKRLGRPAVVSPREYEAIDGWRRRGIPLSVVLEVIAVEGKRRAGSGTRALTSISRAVEEAWRAVASGRTAATPGERPAAADPRARWETIAASAAAPRPLRALLAHLLDDARADTDPAALDAALDAGLASAVDLGTLARAQEETSRTVAPYRARMSAAEFEGMEARALVDRLRATIGLPRLALSR